MVFLKKFIPTVFVFYFYLSVLFLVSQQYSGLINMFHLISSAPPQCVILEIFMAMRT